MSHLILRDFRKRRFWAHLLVHGFACFGFLAAIFGIFDVFFPDVAARAGVLLAGVVVLVSFAYGIFRAWPRPIQQTYASPNTTIRVIEGDLFEETGHLVIGMADTFDTQVPDVIDRNSVQAQFAQRILGGNLQELDRQLDQALLTTAPIRKIDKQGKQDKYRVGTIVTLRVHMRRYFCMAYTEMNERCEARATVDGIWRSLDSLWREVRAEGNGELVSIPVLGGGQARVSQFLPAQDSIRFIILSFILESRKEKVCNELNILVRPAEFGKLDRLELQSFLKSLRPS